MGVEPGGRALGLLWAPHGAPYGEVDFPWLPGRADAAVRIPPASDSPANPAQTPWLCPPLPIFGRCLLPPAPARCSAEEGTGAGLGRGHLRLSPCPAYPTCLTPAGQLRSSSPGLCLRGQFPLNRLNPRLLHSHKLFGLAHQVSETPPERLCCLGLAPGWFKRCHRCSVPSAAACQCGSPAPGRTLGRTSARRREG